MEKIPLKMVSARQAHSLEREIDVWREGCVLSYKWCFACNLKGQQEFPGPFDPCDNLQYIFLNILQRATSFLALGIVQTEPSRIYQRRNSPTKRIKSVDTGIKCGLGH